ncbi:MAG: VWA domain-containing protein [bacterium]|nr:VWA domain-containing protein [bacterium]
MSRSVRFLTVLSLCVLTMFAVSGPARAEEAPAAPPDLLLILDASGSMWGHIQGENKIVIARRVIKELVGELPEGSEVGLVAYGHRREGDCDDIETIAEIAALDKAAFTGKVEALNPKGKTPITKAVVAAFDNVRGRDDATTILLVSDGIETCGGDPCQAVRDAKASGIEFVMHVVGFDVAKEDVSQLECAAQAGGGLYFDAQNAEELSEALEAAAWAPPEIPDGRLSLKAVANGELTDVTVNVTDSETGEEIAGGRTYTSPDTNPRLLPLPDGVFDVRVKAVGMKGNIDRRFERIEIKDGSKVERQVDFSTGELAIGITRNGELSDATVRVFVAGTNEQVAGSRSYDHEKSNPAVFKLTSGDYDVEVRSVEISGDLRHRIEGITVDPRGRAERSHEFSSGTLKIGAIKDGDLVDVTTHIANAEGKAVAQGRTYTSEKTNPKTWEVVPGKYKVKVKAVRLEGKPSKEVEVTVEQGKTTEHMVDFGG